MLSIFLSVTLKRCWMEVTQRKKLLKIENIVLPQNKKEWIATEDVKYLSLDSLLVKYNITKIDLLIIDGEGYDYEIINAILFIMIKPKVIIYEHSHLDEFTKTESSNFLSNIVYKIRFTPEDTIAGLL